jgi:hypothetical protein
MQVTSWRYPAFADLLNFLLRPDSCLSEQEKEDMLACCGINQGKSLSKNAVDAIGSNMKAWWPKASDYLIEEVSTWYRSKQAELDDEILRTERTDAHCSFDATSDSAFYKPRSLPRKIGKLGQNPACKRSERAVWPLGGGKVGLRPPPFPWPNWGGPRTELPPCGPSPRGQSPRSHCDNYNVEGLFCDESTLALEVLHYELA